MTGLVLAAGKSERFGTQSKVHTRCQGRSLLERAICAFDMITDRIITVVAPVDTKTAMVARNSGSEVVYQTGGVYGTGAAVLAARSEIPDGEEILITFADKPFINPGIWHRLIDKQYKSMECPLVFATAIMPVANTKGRVIRSGEVVVEIRERCDWEKGDEDLREVHAGFIIADAEVLFKRLGPIQPNARSGEVHLTEIYKNLTDSDVPIATTQVTAIESVDINTQEDLQSLYERLRH